MSKATISILTCILTSLFLFTNCHDLEDSLNLRSQQNDAFYWENNKLAAGRLKQIMYHTEGEERQERFKIVHISDTHLSSWSSSNHYKLPINLRQSVQFANQPELRINALVATGDFISHGKKKEAIEYMRSFVSFFYQENFIPSFLCTGNHDSNADEEFSDSFLYKSEITPILNSHRSQGKNENYYYSDLPNPQGGIIRIIALDMLDQPGNSYNTLYNAVYSQKQIDWLANTALKEGMSDQHSIILLNHFPFQRHDSGASTYLCDGDFAHPWNMIPEIIEAYRGRTRLVKDYPDKFKKNDLSANYDFTDSKGEFICYLGGHIHCNTHFEINQLSNENPALPKQKMIICTNQAPSEKGTIYNRVERKDDSLSSNSFCIYAIDTNEKKIFITYFGAYKPSNDREYPEIQCLSYL